MLEKSLYKKTRNLSNVSFFSNMQYQNKSNPVRTRTRAGRNWFWDSFHEEVFLLGQ